jgi:1,4-alpha-glucan branching enzyme
MRFRGTNDKSFEEEKLMTAKKKRVEFKIFVPEAGQVLLAGSFNKWSESSDPMKKDHTGTWKKVKMLPAGKYEYKFIVDCVWMLDPQCHDIVSNQYGTENNVIQV